MTNAERDALLVRLDERMGHLVQASEQHTARATGIEGRVRSLEDVAAELRGVGRAVRWAIGGGLAGAIALLAQLLGLAK